jgi:tetratricopeptide (TPR) repeat protein
MHICNRSSRWTLLFVITVGFCLPAGTQTQGGVTILLGKARSLEARGRIDLAAQNWQQVLLVNPDQAEALAGLARSAKQNGDAQAERGYLDHLRKINPRDPAIAAVERMHVPTQQERERLDEAGRLTMQHKADEAVKIYHEIFGDDPPPGKWAGPFYEAEAASSGGRERAIAHLRRLCAREPDNEISRLWLSLVLTYDPKTRMEGFRLLETIKDPGASEQARGPWRQALMWEKENPAVLKSLEAYVQRYPDPELQGILASLREKEEHAIADANKERGFQALHNKDLGTAQTRFEEVLRRSPNDLNAIAGLGFVRLNQKRFSDALSLFERARALAPQRADLREGYETAKFWLAMQRGNTAVQQGRPDSAIAAYQEALVLHPQDEQALLALGQAMVRAKRYVDAEAEFTQVLGRSPANVDAMAGLGFIRLNQKRFDEAQKLLGDALKLAPSRKDIDEGYRNAKYWGVMKRGADALAQNRGADAVSRYQEALAVHPGATDALLGLAESSERNGSYADAVKAYNQYTAAIPGEMRGWLGLLRAQLAAKDPSAALATAGRIPPQTKQEIESRPDYLSEMALAYYGLNRPGEGDEALRRALEAANSADTEDALNVRLQVANLLMDQGNAERALQIYKHAADHHPNNAIAWQGLVGVYTRQNNFDAAIATLRAMPESSYATAMKNTSFLNSVAAVYSSAGQCSKAEDFLNRSLSADRAAGRQPAQSTQLQLADIWMRERNYEKARQAYRAILDRDHNSMEAWRNYIAVLHNQRADQSVVAEAKRIPPPLYAKLVQDAGFLTLLASAHRTMGHHEEVIQLLEQARSRYESQRQASPAELDVQLAWAMADTSQHDQELPNLLAAARKRADLTPQQRKTIDEIWSIWSVRRAQKALAAKQPERGVAILLDASQVLPQDPRIQSALGATYLRQHEYRKSLAVYAAWGMAGARAGDYQAAAGAALATHNETLANAYMQEGLQHWPADADLLQMSAKQSVAEGKYDEAKRDLKSALAATRGQATGSQSNLTAEQEPSRTEHEPQNLAGTAPSSSPSTPGCLPPTSSSTPRRFHARLVDAAFVQTSKSTNSQNQPDSQKPADPQNQSAGQYSADPQKEQQIQDQIDVVQNRNSPTTDIGDSVTGRSGDQGFDRLIIQDGMIGDSITFGNRVRFAVEGHGVYLFSGTPSGTPGLQFGTLPAGAAFEEQTAGGFAGLAQLSTKTLGLAFGTSPQGFPTHNVTGGLRVRPLGGPFTFMFVRDSVKDSLLSYAGVRDPGTGTVWGGVVSNTGSVQLNRNSRTNGQYIYGGYSLIQGTNVPDNWSITASAGTYWHILKGLTLGLSAAGTHYDRNLSFFTLGQGGYFSPQQYYQASIPISWFARHRRFEYEIRAALGVQYIANDASPFFPTQPQLSPGSFYSSSVHTGPNYNFELRLGYRVASHWYFEPFATGNNSQNFATQTIGFRLKYLFHRLPANTDLHVNSIPDWTGKQPFSLQ